MEVLRQQAPGKQLFEQLHASEQGLTRQEVRQRLREAGPNEAAAVQHMAGIVQFLRLFLNPLIAILLLASAVAAFLGDLINASIIVVMVLLGIILNFVQTYRSQRAAERLRAEVAPTATVRRDGDWIEIPRREVVPGDIIRLAAGDLVPADARMLQAVDLHVQQAALTGESLPVEKVVTEEKMPETPSHNLAEAPNMVFLGTSVVSGTATALITATGRNTAFGDIVVRLAHRPPETEFERGTRHFGLLIMQTVFFLILFVFFIGVAFRHPLFESVLFAVALAVGLTPEFLPMITTVTLGQGASRMAKQKVIVKHLESMQNFGSIDVLCSDKTGTLTSGTMALNEHLDVSGASSEWVFLFASFGNVIKYLLMGTSSNFGNMFSMAGAFVFLPFLPMLPTQILLNNFLYDLAQVTIPTDNVDDSFMQKPQHWDISLIRNFMVFIGPVSSIYDFLTFFIMLTIFHASESLFHTGWFVESLATQTLVLFIIRTAGNPLRSRPSVPLTITTLLVVAVGVLLPYTPLAHDLGFTPLPALYFLFLALMTVTYLLLVELVKRRLMGRLSR